MKRVIWLLFLGIMLFAENIEVTSKKFEADQKLLISKFIGDVVVKKGKDLIKADRVDIFFNKEKKPIKVVAAGHINFEVMDKNKKIYKGKCQKLIYFPQKKEYFFQKDVYILQLPDNKKLYGDELILNLKNSNVKVKGNEKKPVKIILKLEENDKN